MSARHSCGLVVPWDHRLVVPCESGFASHGHAVIFPFLEETKIAIDKSDKLMLTYRNLGRLDMADIAEAGTDVPSIEGPEWTSRRGIYGWPYVGEIGGAKGRGGARKGVTGVGGENDVVSGAASGDGGTGMLEGTANGDGETGRNLT